MDNRICQIVQKLLQPKLAAIKWLIPFHLLKFAHQVKLTLIGGAIANSRSFQVQPGEHVTKLGQLRCFENAPVVNSA